MDRNPEIHKGQVWTFKENDADIKAKIKILKVEEDKNKPEHSFGKKCLIIRKSAVKSLNLIEEDNCWMTDFMIYSMFDLVETKENEVVLF